MRLALAISILALSVASVSAKAADVAAGEKIFTKCMQCHHVGVGATNFYGPVLNGLIGRKAGAVPGYDYSVALKKSKIVWNYAALSKYLRKPQHAIPGVEMTFKGLQDQADIDNVIAYVSQFRRDGGRD